MKNLEFRKKAMNKMMMDKPSLSVSIVKKKEPMLDMEGMPEMPDMEGLDMDKKKEPEPGEYVSMMVTPEEKALLEKLRSKSGMPKEMSDEESEGEVVEESDYSE